MWVVSSFFERVDELVSMGCVRPATVTWRRGPSSGKAGAKAIVLADGSVEGWLGGACARPTVVAAALESLVDGRPRLLVLGEHDHRPEVVNVAMACSSEGAMEVFVEPQLAGAGSADHRLVADGDDPGRPGQDARLAGGGHGRAGTGRSRPGSWIVVATQGHYDEPALEAALATPAGTSAWWHLRSGPGL